MKKEMLLYIKLKKYVNKVIWEYLGSNILHKYTVSRLIEDTDYIRLVNSNKKYNSKRVILLNTPLHENLGDHAIALAERNLISSEVGEENLYEFTGEECTANLSDIAKEISEDDIIVITGGGFLGTLWPKEENNVIQILNCFRKQKIVVFPQTIYFDETTLYGKKELVRFSEAVNSCKDITIFTRDRNSYEWLNGKGILQKEKFFLIPDIVMSYNMTFSKRIKREKIIWLCLRQDKEKIFQEDNLKLLLMELRKTGYKVMKTNTVIEKGVSKEERYDAVNRKLIQFARGALVITDRLHGMIFSALSATPCIALDNRSKKVSGGYAWLTHLDYVKCISKHELNLQLVLEMLKKGNCVYDNKCLQPYYKLIREQFGDNE